MFPTLLHIGHVALPTFGVLAAVGLLCALMLSERTARVAGVPAERLWDAGLLAVLAAFVTSRGLLLAAHPRYFMAYPWMLLAMPSLTAPGLAVTVGAMVAWLRWKGLPVLRALDAWAPCGTLVWAFLALGHFAEGSDPGMPARFGIAMPGESTPLHPVALYAAAAAALLTVALYRWLAWRPPAGAVAGGGLAAAGLAQFALSFLRQPGVEGWAGLDVLEWVALGLMACGAVMVAAATGRGAKYDGNRVVEVE